MSSKTEHLGNRDRIGTRVVRLGVPSDHCSGRKGYILEIDPANYRCRVRWDTDKDGMAMKPISTWVKVDTLQPVAEKPTWEVEKGLHSDLEGCFISFACSRLTSGNPVRGWLRNLHKDGQGFEIQLVNDIAGMYKEWKAGDLKTFRTEHCTDFKRLVHQ